MLVIGAKGHAKDIVAVLDKHLLKELVFYDDVSKNIGSSFLGEFPLIRDLAAAKEYFKDKRKEFTLGVGGPLVRKNLSEKFSTEGFIFTSVISGTSTIGTYKVHLGQGLNIMHNVFISNSVKIGNGVLLNAGVLVHHDCKIGDYVEVSPGAVVLGGAKIGNLSFIGASATILPNVKVGQNVVIGAGAVVIKDVPSNSVIIGVPGRLK